MKYANQLANVAQYAAIGSATVALSPHVQSHGLSVMEASIGASLNAATALIVALTFATWARGRSLRTLAALGSLAYAAALAATLVWTTFWVYAASSIIMGIGCTAFVLGSLSHYAAQGGRMGAFAGNRSLGRILGRALPIVPLAGLAVPGGLAPISTTMILSGTAACSILACLLSLGLTPALANPKGKSMAWPTSRLELLIALRTTIDLGIYVYIIVALKDLQLGIIMLSLSMVLDSFIVFVNQRVFDRVPLSITGYLAVGVTLTLASWVPLAFYHSLASIIALRIVSSAGYACINHASLRAFSGSNVSRTEVPMGIGRILGPMAGGLAASALPWTAGLLALQAILVVGLLALVPPETMRMFLLKSSAPVAKAVPATE
jgi:hypothetical protein